MAQIAIKIVVAAAIGSLVAASVFAAPIAAPAPSLVEKASKLVTVDGRTYRVIFKEGAVMVHNKAIASRFSIDERDRQREAVRQATGCEPIDEFDSVAAGRLKARLDCVGARSASSNLSAGDRQ